MKLLSRLPSHQDKETNKSAFSASVPIEHLLFHLMQGHCTLSWNWICLQSHGTFADAAETTQLMPVHLSRSTP